MMTLNLVSLIVLSVLLCAALPALYIRVLADRQNQRNWMEIKRRELDRGYE
jgi:hypothetical protein